MDGGSTVNYPSEQNTIFVLAVVNPHVRPLASDLYPCHGICAHDKITDRVRASATRTLFDRLSEAVGAAGMPSDCLIRPVLI